MGPKLIIHFLIAVKMQGRVFDVSGIWWKRRTLGNEVDTQLPGRI